ncbi:MAG: hypothetical protein Fur0037_27000 [Planctomycetota bacterium]
MTRVLICGAWDEGPGYPRARAIRDALKAAGAEVRECRAPPLGTSKQRVLRRPWLWPLWFARETARRILFRRRLASHCRHDPPSVALVPYPGHLYVRDVRRIVKAPVVLDLFLPAFETAVEDRRLFAPRSLPARYLDYLDRRACECADLVLLDTEEHAASVSSRTGASPARFAELPVSDPDAPAVPAPYELGRTAPLELLFFGTGVPLHGLPVLLDAVAETPRIRLSLIGGARPDRARAARLGDRVRLLPVFVSRARLQQEIDRSDVVAGIFSANPKAMRVVPFKVVHALASGRPVVTADSPAVRRLIGTDKGAILVPPADAVSLASTLAALDRDRAVLARAAARARETYDRVFSIASTSERLAALLRRCAAKGADDD